MPVYEIKRSAREIDEVLNKTAEAMDNGTNWPGMSYEDGVRAAIDWLVGTVDDNPMED